MPGINQTVAFGGRENGRHEQQTILSSLREFIPECRDFGDRTGPNIEGTLSKSLNTKNLKGPRSISWQFCVSRRQASPKASFDELPNRGRWRRNWLADGFGTM